jgi:hypothetical protein
MSIHVLISSTVDQETYFPTAGDIILHGPHHSANASSTAMPFSLTMNSSNSFFLQKLQFVSPAGATLQTYDLRSWTWPASSLLTSFFTESVDIARDVVNVNGVLREAFVMTGIRYPWNCLILAAVGIAVLCFDDLVSDCLRSEDAAENADINGSRDKSDFK